MPRGASQRRSAAGSDLGIQCQTVGYIERGEYAPSLHLALRIARFFDLPIEVSFALDPFDRLGAEALSARPGDAAGHD